MHRVLVLVVIVCFFALWQALCGSGGISPLLLPSPRAIGAWLLASLSDGSLPQATLVTLRRLLFGYLSGLALGLPLGVLTRASRLANDTLGLAALGLQTLPSVCWTPLALLWFGQSEAAMLFVVIMGSMWSAVLATRDSLGQVPTLWIKVAQVMGTGRMRMWTGVLLPAALPGLLAGARLSWAFAWRSLMAAEIYVSVLDRMGLGQLLHYGRELMAMEQTMGVMLVIITIGMVADRALFLPLERILHEKRGV